MTVARRERLVTAAFDTIAEAGFEGLRLREVAARAGIDHSTLHHHFATKQDLIAEVLAFVTRQFWPTMPADGPPEQRLRRHLTALADMIQRSPHLFVVLDEFDTRARRDPVVQEIVAQHEAGWRALLTQTLHECGIADPAVTTELIIATVKGVSLVPVKARQVLTHLTAILTP